MRTILFITIALLSYGALAYALFYAFVLAPRREVKKAAGVHKLSDKHITVTGDIVRYKRSKHA